MIGNIDVNISHSYYFAIEDGGALIRSVKKLSPMPLNTPVPRNTRSLISATFRQRNAFCTAAAKLAR